MAFGAGETGIQRVDEAGQVGVRRRVDVAEGSVSRDSGLAEQSCVVYPQRVCFTVEEDP